MIAFAIVAASLFILAALAGLFHTVTATYDAAEAMGCIVGSAVCVLAAWWCIAEGIPR